MGDLAVSTTQRMATQGFADGVDQQRYEDARKTDD